LQVRAILSHRGVVNSWFSPDRTAANTHSRIIVP
jgi:hypothetical protein